MNVSNGEKQDTKAPAATSADGGTETSSYRPPLLSLDRYIGERVMIFSPHPEDDTLGCGGTTRLLFESGCNILAIYMTDGRFGCPTMSPEETASIRRLESVNSATVLGIANLQFMNRPEGGLRCDRITIKEAREAMQAYNPSLVLVPDPDAGHPDHRAAYEIVLAATAGEAVEVLRFGVYNAVRPDVVVDITKTMAYKEKAMREHRTQQDREDYVSKVMGLNAYLSIGRGPEVQFCEAFSRLQGNDQ